MNSIKKQTTDFSVVFVFALIGGQYKFCYISIMPNKNTKTIYEFYASLLANPKLLKNKNICLLALGNCMNPPYDGNLYLKILDAVIPHAEKIVNISPIYWLSYINRNKKEFCTIKNIQNRSML